MLVKRFLVGLITILFSLNAQAFLFFNSANQQDLKSTILAHAPGLNPHVLNLALTAYSKLHQQGYDNQQVLTIIDYSKPSTQTRLWVIDLKKLAVPFSVLVAHGKNSGDNVSHSFSNDPSSLKSSLGVYLTGNTYIGKHGYSLKLNGLEPGFNDKANAREIVIHAADYVNEAFAKIHGRLGRSWGCPAIDPRISNKLIADIKDGTVLFAYYPDQKWLSYSRYVGA